MHNFLFEAFSLGRLPLIHAIKKTYSTQVLWGTTTQTKLIKLKLYTNLILAVVSLVMNWLRILSNT